jgi:hypothetical protein
VGGAEVWRGFPLGRRSSLNSRTQPERVTTRSEHAAGSGEESPMHCMR